MRVRVLSTTVLLVGTAVFVGAPPAGAASLSVSGTELTVTSTTDEQIRFTCQGGTIRVNGTASSPTLACGVVTKVTVTSVNSTAQTVQGTGLNDPAFTAGPSLTANLGGGDDSVSETDRSDTLNLGGGDDQLTLRMPTAPNATPDMGTGADDEVTVRTIDADDTTAATSANASVFVGVTSSGGATSFTVLNAEELRLETLDGDDTLSTTGVTAASTIERVVLVGGHGDDTLRSGPSGVAQLQGNAGTNAFIGGAAANTMISASETDQVTAGTGTNSVQDTSSLRSGGRTVANTGSINWYLGAYPGDVVVRTRGTKVTTALTRPGQQSVNGAVDQFDIALNNNTEPQSRAIVDVIATNRGVSAKGANNLKEVMDVYIPSGSWGITGIGNTVIVDPTDPGYGNITAIDIHLNVHGPFADTNQHYAHRVIRDLLFRIPTDAERDQLRGQLNNGTKTPATAVAGLMNTDEYRGLDVDRVFVKYLRRVADPGGRTYWINSLKGGKALWRFRAQLFGSNEYFAKAGGTNAAYVTRAYNDVLGRNPDPSGQTYWTNKLNNGADRGSVALQFINSPEARRRLVDDQFLRFAEEKPTQAQQDFWVAKLPSDTGELQLIAALASDSEYYTYD